MCKFDGRWVGCAIPRKEVDLQWTPRQVYCTGRRLTDGEYGVMKGNWERRRAGLVYRLGIAVQGPAKLKAARVDRSAAEPLSRER